MALEFDPAWEYYAHTDEMEDYWASVPGCPPMAAVSDFRMAGREGLRLGRGNPDSYEPRLARDRWRWRPDRPEIPPRPCGTCRRVFRPDRKGRRYCSADCVPRPGRARVRPDSRGCGHCGKAFAPNKVRSVYCSRSCGGQAHQPKADRSAERAALEAAGVASRPCKHCGGPVPPGANRNGLARLYCRPRCKRSFMDRQLKQRRAAARKESP